LIQFISFQGPWFLDAISWILLSKNDCFVSLIVLLNNFQSFTCLDILYFASLNWQSSFHHTLKYFVILMSFECLNQMSSDLLANIWTVRLKVNLLVRFSVSSLLMLLMSSAMDLSFSSLILMIVYLLVRTCSLLIEILTVSGAWFYEYLYSEWIIWLLSFNKFGLRNIRLMTEFDSFILSEYLVKTWLVDLDKHKSIKSVMLVRRLLWKEWYRKNGS